MTDDFLMGPISENKASKWCRRTELVGGIKRTKTVQAVDFLLLLLLFLLLLMIKILESIRQDKQC
jgi:hypothetical protein